MDMTSLTPFSRRVYTILLTVPAGRVTTYKELARAAGTGSSRAIGQAMRRNPFAPTVPCHRVVSADGTIGGFMGEKNGEALTRKIRLLESEGVKIDGRRVRDFSRVFFRFP
jgi:methylated-DNA-[protein]-cysteine S-methyltransferase